MDRQKEREKYFLTLVHLNIVCSANECFGVNDTIHPIDIKATPNNDDLLAIATNQQNRIVKSAHTIQQILYFLNASNLTRWQNILQSTIDYFNSLKQLCGTTLSNEHILTSR